MKKEFDGKELNFFPGIKKDVLLGGVPDSLKL
jgi:hypothetical protein